MPASWIVLVVLVVAACAAAIYYAAVGVGAGRALTGRIREFRGEVEPAARELISGSRQLAARITSVRKR